MKKGEVDQIEQAAMAAALAPLAEFVEHHIGNRGFYDLEKREICGLIQVVTEAYSGELQKLYSDIIPF